MIRHSISVHDTSSLGPLFTIQEARLLVFMALPTRITETLMSSTQQWLNTISIHHRRWSWTLLI
jgi:uncharacterized protein YqgV (UPF0045/DUF77 family)